MRVFVTGGAGFIGSYLVPRLLDRGHEVVVFDMAAEPKALSSVMGRIGYLRGDLGSAPDLYRAMMASRPEGVFHLGAILAGPCEENPLRGFQVNFGSTQALLDAALALKTKKFFMVSSISVFGRDATEPVQDDAPKNPETIYGQTKLASEHLLSWYARKHGMDTCALRFTWVFGPGRTTGITALYSSLILDSIARGEQIVVGNPEERGDWLYVKDAVKAILLVWDQPVLKQRIFNISGGVHSIRDVVDIALRHRPQSKVTLKEGGGSFSPYPVAYDDRKAREELSWKPDYTIEAAVEEHLRLVSVG
ncbi:MAG: NAD(P)-dependent oxidoreductase [Deltaproteobacteria bacterium]|nr:NAD(P)-dependent oxidoreductase [Deltaproteobacteria bacterium]